MYNVVILYDRDGYNRKLNLIKFEEAKGNLNIIGIAMGNPYISWLDGWGVIGMSEMLKCQWDYLIAMADDKDILELKEMLQNIGISGEKVLSADIFSIANFDFEDYVNILQSKPTIMASHCWGDLHIIS